MNHLTVVAKFIRVDGVIINVGDIVRVWTETCLDSTSRKYEITKMTLKNSHKYESTQSWSGDIKDEIWELLQAASTQHLDPHDRLRLQAVI